jgi:CRISPR-associated endonuclease/helicase Cas3
MDRIAQALRLEPGLREVLVMAAEQHDLGKARPIWQRYANNPDPAEPPLAKSMKYLDGRRLGGYRHEFGSVLEAGRKGMRGHPRGDLVLHLVAAHHGWASPHFDLRAWDETRTEADNEEAAIEVMQRFGRLQQRFGRWGLAWLESLVRCADIAASKVDTLEPGQAQSEGMR